MSSGHFAALGKEPESDPCSHLVGGHSCFQNWALSECDVHLSSAWCIFSLRPGRELSKRPSGSGTSGNALHGLSLWWKRGPKPLNALWLPAGKPMDMQTVGVLSNDRGDGLLFPLPFPAVPELLFQGRAVSRGSGACLSGLVSISDARHRVAGVTEAVTSWNVCCLEWEIILWEKCLPCKGPTQTSRRHGGLIPHVGSQIHSCFGHGMDEGKLHQPGLGKCRTRCCSYCQTETQRQQEKWVTDGWFVLSTCRKNKLPPVNCFLLASTKRGLLS